MSHPERVGGRSGGVRRDQWSKLVSLAALPILLLSSHCTPPFREGIGNDAEPSIAVGDACDELGLSVCAGSAQKQRLICQDGVYRVDAPCGAGENCDQVSGGCSPIIAECSGRPVGARFCSATAGIMVCGLDLVRVESEPCAGNCVDGNCVTNDQPTATCGDGVTRAPEECDDGNALDDDGCADCRVVRCGDGGNALDSDGCTNACRLPRCGDAIVQAGEACDDGNAVDTDACSNACRVQGCGDGIVQLNEEC